MLEQVWQNTVRLSRGYSKGRSRELGCPVLRRVLPATFKHLTRRYREDKATLVLEVCRDRIRSNGHKTQHSKSSLRTREEESTVNLA